MGLEDRLDRLRAGLKDWLHIHSRTEINEDNWERLEVLEVKIDWLIEKLIDEPAGRAGGADSVELLRRLVDANRIEERGVMECRCCGTVGCIGLQDGRRVAPHQPDCPWVAAKAFVDGFTPDPS